MNNDNAARFRAVRKLFPHTKNIIFFNSASYGPCCTPVQKAVEGNIALRLASEIDDSHNAFADRTVLRSEFAKLIGAAKREVGLGMNTSFGLNLAAFGLPLKSGDEVILTKIEFPAAVYTWRAAAETRKLKLKFIDAPNNQFCIDTFEKAITRRTKVLVISWVQFFNGYKVDLAELSEICKKRNIFLVVDGIQGMGAEPINMRKLGIDIFTSGCHKWMLAPQGGGFFYLSDEIRGRIEAPFMSWLGVDWNMQFSDLFHYEKPYFDSAEKYELGYFGVLNILGMNATVKLFRDLGLRNIQRHNYELIDRLADYIRSEPFYSITSNLEPKHRSSIFTFRCKKVPALHEYIVNKKIMLANREDSIRVSVHLFNNKADIDRLIYVLKTFAKKNR